MEEVLIVRIKTNRIKRRNKNIASKYSKVIVELITTGSFLNKLKTN